MKTTEGSLRLPLPNLSHVVSWGIIGCGDVTERKSPPAAFNRVSQNGESSVVAVMRRNAALAADFAGRHGVKKWYNNADDLFQDKELNAVYIATPPSSHRDYALRALREGFAVYCEKPVAMNSAETQQLLDLVNRDGSTRSLLTVAHYRRALPMFLRVKSLLQENHIGNVNSVTLRCWQAKTASMSTAAAADRSAGQMTVGSDTGWRLDPVISGGGYFHDLSPHQLDLLLFFFGMPVSFKRCDHDPTVIDSTQESTVSEGDVFGEAQFQNNVHFAGSWKFSVAAEQARDECIIVGSAGSLQFGFFGTTGYIRIDSVAPTNSTATATAATKEDINSKSSSIQGAQHVTEQFIHPDPIQGPMLEQTINYFLDPESPSGNGQHNPCSIAEALVVMQLIDEFANVAL